MIKKERKIGNFNYTLLNLDFFSIYSRESERERERERKRERERLRIKQISYTLLVSIGNHLIQEAANLIFCD